MFRSRGMKRVLVLALLLGVFSYGAFGQECEDKEPEEYTCAQQKQFGKCDAEWMLKSDYCARTCGRCCSDLRPSGLFSASCDVRKDRGECKALVANGECLATCGACSDKTFPQVESEDIESALATEDEEELVDEEEEEEDATSKAAGLDEDEKVAAEYKEKLLEEVETLEEDDDTVEVLPTLTLPGEIPAGSKQQIGSPVGEIVEKEEIVCNQTALDAVKNDLDLTMTYKAIQALNLAGVLKRDDIMYTLLAPTNEAWETAAAALGVLPEDILGAPAELKNIVFTHIIPNIALDEEALKELISESAQSGSLLFFGISDGDVTVVSTGSTAIVSGPDSAVGCNFVVHKIDNVLLSKPTASGVNPDFQQALKTGQA
eukprot:jgi/Picsp_1/1116/NSC_04598-R1_fasciclin-like protein